MALQALGLLGTRCTHALKKQKGPVPNFKHTFAVILEVGI